MRKAALDILEDFIVRYPKLDGCKQDIARAFLTLKHCFNIGGKLLACGNGGSAADTEHIVGELMKGFTLERKLSLEDANRLKQAFPKDWEYLSSKLQRGLSAISLVSQVSLATAVGNDIAADMVFAQQVYGYGKEGDVLVGLSSSGNAANVINAIKVARAFGLKTICITGMDGGVAAHTSDITILLPEIETYKIQELTLPVYHALCLMLEHEYYED